MTTLDHTNDRTNSDTLMEDNFRIGPKDGMARMTIFEEVCLPHWSVSIEHEATTNSFFLQGDSGILSYLLLEQYYDEQPLQIVLIFI
jgi:hypothetical protein